MNLAQAQLIQAETQRLAWALPQDWGWLHGGRLLLTGCTGPFGLWLLHRLAYAVAQEGLELDSLGVLTRRPAEVAQQLSLLPPLPGLRLIEGDIAQIDLAGFLPTHVVHGATTAARETFEGASAISKFDTLVEGSRAIVRLCRLARPQTVLFLGSGVVYGPQQGDGGGVNETCAYAPHPADLGSGLAQGKRAAEFILSCAAAELGFSLTVARCFAFSGPGLPLDVHYALGNFVHQALYEPALRVTGDGTPLRSYLHFGDLAVWLLRMLAPPTADQVRMPRIYNVGSDQPLSIAKLAYQVTQVLSPEKPVQVLGQAPDLAQNINRSVYVPRIEKARRELGLDVWTDLSVSIQQMAMFEQARSAP
jgi:nucleoside-diphosphate-sugar epimerase